MTPEQIKEALQGEWLREHITDIHTTEDCKTAEWLEQSCEGRFGMMMLAYLMNDPTHRLMHLFIDCCRFGYEYRKREEGVAELERLGAK